MDDSSRVHMSWGHPWPASEDEARRIVNRRPADGAYASAQRRLGYRTFEPTDAERYALFWGDVYAAFFPDDWF